MSATQIGRKILIGSDKALHSEVVGLPDNVRRWKIKTGNRGKSISVPFIYMTTPTGIEVWTLEDAGTGKIRPAFIVAANRRANEGTR